MDMDTSVFIKHPDKLFIGGEWVEASTDAQFTVVSSSTEDVIFKVAAAQVADVDRAVASAREAFDNGPWPRLLPRERAEFVRKLGAGLARRKDDFARVYVHQSGIILSLAHSRADPHIWNHFADLAEDFTFERAQPTVQPGMDAIIVHEPVGVVGAIIAWNGPMDQIVLKCAPALLAGCCVVLKAPPEAPGEAYLFAELAEEIGLPPGVFNVVTADRDASEALVANQLVDKITFTGSSATGKHIAGICSKRLARCTLELGGKSPAIILDDYDLALAADSISASTAFLTNQVCAALTRVLLSRERHDAFVALLRQRFESIVIGDPFDPATAMGPLAMKRQLDRVLGYIELGKAEGAVLVSGGSRPSLNHGFYVEPTIFANVSNNMRIAQEEIFGPIVCVIPFESEDDAVRIANATATGLNASVFTNDRAKALELARRIRSGSFGHNGLRGDFTLPFGGFKESGLGREGGVEGLLPFLETKTVFLEKQQA
jgi:acyl-CoA reductase-like NAD-dependent aldehyde dehydrogenase